MAKYLEYKMKCSNIDWSDPSELAGIGGRNCIYPETCHSLASGVMNQLTVQLFQQTNTPWSYIFRSIAIEKMLLNVAQVSSTDMKF